MARLELNGQDDFDRARADADRALALARSAGDPTFELEALHLVAQIEAERGETNPDAWLEIEQLARRAGRWETVARAIQAQASLLLDDDPDRALPFFDAAAELCVEQGLVEMAAWCDYGRAEAHFAAGRWDEAIEVGSRAIAAGEAHDFHRVVIRSWFVLLPLARARGRLDLVEQAYPHFAARSGREPMSPYARVVTTAAHLHFAAAGLEPPFVPDVEERLGSFDLDHGGPSWLAAVEMVVGAWLDAGELHAAEQALDRMRDRLARGSSSAFARAVEALLRARLLLALGEPDSAAEAERALAELGDRAPWWRGKAIRVLEDAGAATPALLGDAVRIEEQSGGVEKWLAFSSYCWKTTCVDFIPPAMRTNLPALSVRRGGIATLHLRFAPERLSVSAVTGTGAGKPLRLACGRVASWRPKASGLMLVTATAAASGDASYLVRVRLR